MSPGILIFATANRFPCLLARNCSAYLENSEAFRQRALCGVRETRALSELLSASYFIQAQIFPYNYQDVIVRGNATRINALFLREYFRQRHSIPELPMVRAFEGGYTDIFFTGVAHNVWHCDVASLYPSIMLKFDCFPVTDQSQIFRHLLTDLRTFRLEAKAEMRAEKDPAKQHHLQALQNTFKILLNSFYGYLGFAQGNFADFDAAARVTQIGRDLLKKMIDWLGNRGAQVIEVDTDGIYFVPPAKIKIDELRDGLAKELPEELKSISTNNSAPCSATRRRITHSLPKMARWLSRAAPLNRADSKNSSACSWRK